MPQRIQEVFTFYLAKFPEILLDLTIPEMTRARKTTSTRFMMHDFVWEHYENIFLTSCNSAFPAVGCCRAFFCFMMLLFNFVVLRKYLLNAVMHHSMHFSLATKANKSRTEGFQTSVKSHSSNMLRRSFALKFFIKCWIKFHRKLKHKSES